MLTFRKSHVSAFLHDVLIWWLSLFSLSLQGTVNLMAYDSASICRHAQWFTGHHRGHVAVMWQKREREREKTFLQSFGTLKQRHKHAWTHTNINALTKAGTCWELILLVAYKIWMILHYIFISQPKDIHKLEHKNTQILCLKNTHSLWRGFKRGSCVPACVFWCLKFLYTFTFAAISFLHMCQTIFLECFCWV